MTPLRNEDDMREVYMQKVGAGILRRVPFVMGGIFLAILLLLSLAYVPAGHVGVLVSFGRVTDRVLPEGTHLVWPWLTNHRLSVRTQELKETASVPSNEGLIVTLEASLLFRLRSENAHEVYRTIGPRYIEVVLEPMLRSAIRSVTAAHNANALYTGERELIAEQI